MIPARAQPDAGTLGVVAVTVNNAFQAATLLRGARGQGLTTLTAGEVVVDVDMPQIPVGIHGETVMMSTPVHCTIQPRALRVREPRNRRGTPPGQARFRLAHALATGLIPLHSGTHLTLGQVSCASLHHQNRLRQVSLAPGPPPVVVVTRRCYVDT